MTLKPPHLPDTEEARQHQFWVGTFSLWSITTISAEPFLELILRPSWF
jgi:hypothetical protein